MSMNCPCKGCTERKLTCHGFCEKYKAWKAKIDERNRKRQLDQENRQLSRDLEMKYRKKLKRL